MSMMLHDEFVHDKEHGLEAHNGKKIASALSGFIAGVLAASILWFAGIVIFRAYLTFAGVH